MGTTRRNRLFRVALTAAMLAVAQAPSVAFAQDQPKADQPTPAVSIGKHALAVAGPLLDQLKLAKDADAADALVAQIWDAWSQSGDPGIDEKMGEAVALMQVQHYDEALAVLDTVVAAAPEFAEG